jgi:mono/diheme cytochrome c family protein
MVVETACSRAQLAGALAALALWASAADAADDQAALARGRYIFHAGACDSCHTDHPNHGAFLAGGRRMETEFGTFHVPNITPDEATGIGRWTAEDFRRSMIEGKTPDGSHYYPVFPYRWYTGMTEQDLADLWAYLRSVPAAENRVRAHDLPFPFNIRALLFGWKLVNFDEGETVHDPERSEDWNRGAYLVNHLGHCGACHTTKLYGNFIEDKFLAGSAAIPGPYPAPNITSHPVTGIGEWSEEDIVRALRRSMTPEGTPIRGPMAEYVVAGTSYLSDEDLRAMAIYLKTVPPEMGPVGEIEERRDRRLDMAEGYDGPRRTGASSAEGSAAGSTGIGLLIESRGGRSLAK